MPLLRVEEDLPCSGSPSSKLVLDALATFTTQGNFTLLSL